MNESITEDLVRDRLRELGYYADGSEIKIEEQQSADLQINKLLKHASKKGSKKGRPDFIITYQKSSPKFWQDFVCVIECKADSTKHQSSDLDQYADYAMDGALLYASYLAKEKDVLAIGVSGQSKEDLKVSHYLQFKGEKTPAVAFDNELLGFDSYLKKYQPIKRDQDYDSLIAYLGKLNKALHSKKILENRRALLFAGILIALQDQTFIDTYESFNAQDLSEHLIKRIIAKLKDANIPKTRVESMRQDFGCITTYPKGDLARLVKEIDTEVYTFAKDNQYTDILSQAYVEFLRYAHNDKALGIVLTPKHITELFCDLAGVHKDSVVFDNCCGTGGFLLAAMKKMVDNAKENQPKIKAIQQEQLVGIEYQDHIFTLCCCNMVIHGDGKTNIIKGNCFKEAAGVKQKFKPTVGLLNPPYNMAEEPELEFVLNNLEILEPNGVCVAIVPMSCVLAQKGKELRLKERLLEQHRLEAVLSMPNQLFHPINPVTAVLVIKAHQPHPEGHKTYFGYWKDDGFVIRKHRGRIDDNNRWKVIRKEWLDSYRNKETKAGLSITKVVRAKDEWCAEAYLETDYSTLTEADFINTVKEYVAFQFVHSEKGEAE